VVPIHQDLARLLLSARAVPKVEGKGKQESNSMNESKISTRKRTGILLFLCLAFAVSAYANISSKHFIGETVAQFAAKVGVGMNACHKKLKLHTWTCTALISAEQGYRVTIEKEGEWSAVLDGGKLVSYNDNLKLPSASPSSVP
jgi:hypothetical protein